MLNKLAAEAYKNAEKRGFFPENGNIEANLFQVVSEVAEIGKALRSCEKDGERAEIENFYHYLNENKNNFSHTYTVFIKDTVEQELAGAIIALMSIAHKLDVDIDKHIELEMEFNRLRGER